MFPLSCELLRLKGLRENKKKMAFNSESILRAWHFRPLRKALYFLYNRSNIKRTKSFNYWNNIVVMCFLHFRGVAGLNPGKVYHVMYKWKLVSLLVVRIQTEEVLNKEVTRLKRDLNLTRHYTHQTHSSTVNYLTDSKTEIRNIMQGASKQILTNANNWRASGCPYMAKKVISCIRKCHHMKPLVCAIPILL